MVVLTVAAKSEAIKPSTLMPSQYLGTGFALKGGIGGDSTPSRDSLATHQGLGDSCGAR